VTPGQIEKEYADAPGYAGFKREVGDIVVELLLPVRERYGPIRRDEATLERILRDGADRARGIAAGTLELAKSRMGLGSPA
jgi:tryptophanyl-tRNA synthetase